MRFWHLLEKRQLSFSRNLGSVMPLMELKINILFEEKKNSENNNINKKYGNSNAGFRDL
jgi:hypothetical protein